MHDSCQPSLQLLHFYDSNICRHRSCCVPTYISAKPFIPSPNKTTRLLRRNHARCLGAVPRTPRTQPCIAALHGEPNSLSYSLRGLGRKSCQNSTSQVPWVPRGYGIKYYSQLTYSFYSLTSGLQNRCLLYLHQRVFRQSGL